MCYPTMEEINISLSLALCTRRSVCVVAGFPFDVVMGRSQPIALQRIVVNQIDVFFLFLSLSPASSIYMYSFFPPVVGCARVLCTRRKSLLRPLLQERERDSLLSC